MATITTRIRSHVEYLQRSYPGNLREQVLQACWGYGQRCWEGQGGADLCRWARETAAEAGLDFDQISEEAGRLGQRLLPGEYRLQT